MTKVDFNMLAVAVVVVILVLIAALFGYRLEIEAIGLTFESGGNTAMAREE